jgi:predicted SAM-dependent methyltransferase
VPADACATVPPLPYPDGSLDEIYAGHVLEHLTPAAADLLLLECRRCLVPGGTMGIVVPDTREIMTRWLAGTADTVEYPADVIRPIADLDEVCALFLYSTVQESLHQWSYDLTTLRRRIERAGFLVTCEIDRWNDPRIPVGAWYQCGWDAVAP